MLLFVNGVHKQCGVYQYGVRLYSQLGIPETIAYAELGSREDYDRHMKGKSYSACIVNYHPTLFHWWNSSLPTYYIYHEFGCSADRARILDTDPTVPTGIPRPLSQAVVPSVSPDIPTFGSFGFGFAVKGFERIVPLVQSQYDTAVIRLLLSGSHYGDPDCSKGRAVVEACRRQITKPGIQVVGYHDFVSEEGVVAFLAENTMNIFLYDHLPGRGCSSVMDYALTARKPIAISDSDMFRHVYSDAICAYKRPLKDILADGDRHLQPFLDRWNPTTLRAAILDRVRNSL